MIEHTGVDGVMVARAALRAPWVLGRIARRLETGEAGPSLRLSEKLRAVRRHLELILEHQDERAALQCLRQRIAWYGKSMGHVKPLKEAVRTATSAGTIARVLDEWLTRAVEAGDPERMPRRPVRESPPPEPEAARLLAQP